MVSAGKIKWGITEEQVKESLTLLKRLGLIKKDPSKGYIKLKAALKTVDDNIINDAKFNYHKSMIDLTKKSLENSPIYEIRELSALTFAIDSEKIPEVIKKMKKLIREVNKISGDTKVQAYMEVIAVIWAKTFIRISFYREEILIYICSSPPLPCSGFLRFCGNFLAEEDSVFASLVVDQG